MKKYMVVLVVLMLVLGVSVTVYSYGMMGNFQGGMFGLRSGERLEYMLQKKATILGITVEELKKELNSGKTFLDLAKARGITEEQLRAKMLEFQKVRLQELVIAGRITQEQADQMLAAMIQHQNLAPCPTCGRGFGFPGGFRGRFNP
ncbi:MAG: hypothetical protein DDT40_00588 [candidate division WS2 bacterium]|uniref:DUF2680 domain-containing protein n=1 Tax=Psychracetigena formicireducens TaxID=2986056 RepID=A0A9E2BI92_PSYF1|nr:hypothetical protein [Candidatus Psychracetigena formicireducens]MBT9145056.1 hypothetical protein [Candidatus Psychracetigena formicireducens]MBT9150416.1 hypothetical protein [Candidatus Psychracetigena formicireducens]